jgi:hypothetical protein
MAITGAKPGGSYFEFDNVATENAIVVFKVRAFGEPRMLKPNSTAPVKPVDVDILVLTGAQAGQVQRGEEVVGAGITGTLRRAAVGDDVVCVMGWAKSSHGTNYVQANPPTPEQLQAAIDIFKKTNGDPYAAAERAANPTGTVTAAAAPAPAPVQVPPATIPQQTQAPAAPPAAAPWGAPAPQAQPAPVEQAAPPAAPWGAAPAAAVTNGAPASSPWG